MEEDTQELLDFYNSHYNWEYNDMCRFIENHTEEEAMALYKSGNYPDSDYVMDDMFYDFEFQQISEIYEKETEPVNYYQGA